MVERWFVEPDTIVRFYQAGPLLFRLTAGLWPLTPAIVVRIHEEQPIRRRSKTVTVRDCKSLRCQFKSGRLLQSTRSATE